MYTGSYKRRFSSSSWRRYRPSQLRFTHDCIKTDFQDGNSMEETLKSIINGTLAVENIQPMLVMQYRGRPHVVYGNRRLYLFQKLEKHGYLDTVTVKEVDFDEDVFEKMYTTTTEGIGIRLRGYHGYRKDEDLDNVIRCHGRKFITVDPERYRVVSQSARPQHFTWEACASPDRRPSYPIYPSTGNVVESESTFSNMCRVVALVFIVLFIFWVFASGSTRRGYY